MSRAGASSQRTLAALQGPWSLGQGDTIRAEPSLLLLLPKMDLGSEVRDSSVLALVYSLLPSCLQQRMRRMLLQESWKDISLSQGLALEVKNSSTLRNSWIWQSLWLPAAFLELQHPLTLC